MNEWNATRGFYVTDYQGEVEAWFNALERALNFAKGLADEHTVNYYKDGQWRPVIRYHTGNLKFTAPEWQRPLPE